MQPSSGTVLSHLRHEIKTADISEPERGVRYWSAVELRSERWFQIESYSYKETPSAQLRTVIVANPEDALLAVQQFEGNTWTVLRIYTRVPWDKETTYIFETVSEILGMPDGSYLFVLESSTVLTIQPSVPAEKTASAEVKQLYLFRRQHWHR